MIGPAKIETVVRKKKEGVTAVEIVNKLAAASLAAVTLAGTGLAKPNIVVIMADDKY